MWPRVSELQDYKKTFPNWTTNQLAANVPTLEKDGLDLLEQMLVYNPIKRISARKALKHPYFNGYDIKTRPKLTF